MNPSEPSADLHRAGDPQAMLDQLDAMQQQLDALQEGLAHSHRLATLGTLTSIIAHEYNNILTPVISYAQLALKHEDDQALRTKALQRALQGAQRASAISASILGFVKQDDETAVCHLPSVVNDTINCLGREPDKDGITLSLELPDVQLAISPLNLQQVLLNLLLNARKAMGRRGGMIQLVGVVHDGRLELQVRDTGPGIPQAIRDRLFEPFATHHATGMASTSPQGLAATGGTGLGLTICRDLVQQVGGQIHVTSELGHGATFTLDLPLALENQAM